jgi:penicillin amidase
VPLLGRRFTYAEWEAEGGNDTLHKTGHETTKTQHDVTFGASARFLTDLSDPDSNQVALLGGQDGWLGSSTFLDMAALWRHGGYVSLPMRPETARAWPHRTVLSPG